MIKWMNLTRGEAVEVLSGVWPGFKGLSEDKALVDFTPQWFKRIYAPESVEKEVYQEISLGEEASVVSPRSAPNLIPLLLWLAENRVRTTLTEHLPRVRRAMMRTVVPLAAVFFIYRTMPKTQKPISHMFLIVFIVYIWSITRGLPVMSESFFKTMGISLYRKKGERRFNTNQNNGNFSALLFALIEPFVPIINASPFSPSVSPKSSHSQASTLAATEPDKTY